jgi:hypothetical protein
VDPIDAAESANVRNRLHALCPYFAMFPESFVEAYVLRHTNEGDYVFDPFSGRGTTVLQSLLMGRRALATDINPVAYCISAAKADVPSLESVLEEIDELDRCYQNCHHGRLRDERRSLPAYFGRAFHYATLEQLLFLRRVLDWRGNTVQRFIAALTLGTLHGEMDNSSRYLSNQMPRTISPKPAYSLRYWRSHGLWPKKKDVFDRLRSESSFRLWAELPRGRGLVVLADARDASERLRSLEGKVAAVITSPPYFNVTDCAEDQWLRLWFLGHEPHPTYGRISRDDRHENKEGYWQFLCEAWAGIRDLLRPSATLVCRLGGTRMDEAELTRGLLQSVQRAFPASGLIHTPMRTELRKRQTPAFRPGSVGCRFEVDYVFNLGAHAW